jgi:2-polyprenyl-3-methyl-5-hydroxy-6-metoxy-1,4-benzoquinol methylase
MKVEDILIDPIHKNKINIDWQNGIISNIDKSLFYAEIVKGVPVILPIKLDDSQKTSDLHQKQQSSFEYVDHYTKDAEEFDYFKVEEAAITKDERHRLDQKIINVIPTNATRILDVGCGNGWLNKALVSNKVEVISLDIALKNAEKAYQNNPHPNHSAVVADVYHLPFEEGSIDAIVASEIIEHVPNPRLFIEKLLIPLKKGGKLIITTPYNEQISSSLCIHCNKSTPINAHLHSFTEDSMVKNIPSDVSLVKMSTINNKFFIKSRLSLLMKKLPFGIWYYFDKLASLMINKPFRLVIEIVK